MKKVELSHDIIQYIFEPTESKQFGNNIIALIDGKKAMLIDVGNEEQIKQVIDDLQDRDVIIEQVIISHFHKNHMKGLDRLPGVIIYGSSHYIHTLDLYSKPEEQIKYTPTKLVEKSLIVDFGRHTLKLIQNPGHTLCTLLVKINENMIYIGDEIAYGVHGSLVLPRITKNDIINQYISIHNMKKYANYMIIPGHGDAFHEPAKLEMDIKNICHYLCEILSNDSKISVDQALKQCSCEFLHKEWHDNIYQ